MKLSRRKMKIIGFIFALGLIACFSFNSAVSAYIIIPPPSGISGSFKYTDGKTYCGVAYFAWVKDYSK